MRLKNIATVIVAVGLALSLGGCSTIKGWLPLTPQQIAQQQRAQKAKQAQELKKECDQSNVLLSNLSKSVDKRQYSLSPGVVCHD